MCTMTRMRLKLSLVAIMLIALVASAVASQPGAAPFPAGSMEPDFWRWAIIQGGLLVALLIVLWSYRKDLVGALVGEREQLAIMIELVRSSTAANEKSAAASEATEKALHRLARALDTFHTGRIE